MNSRTVALPLTRRRLLLSGLLASLQAAMRASAAPAERPPNILLAISDDQSWAHTGASGDPVVSTPAFDRIAREGVRFTHSFCAAPTCTASRAALLTGQAFCRLEESANLWSTLAPKFAVYPDLLEAAGYAVGVKGKGWGPGDATAGGRTRNPAGPPFRDIAAFLQRVPADKPFCFWFGSQDPHRPYTRAERLASGKTAADMPVPPFLPDTPEVRADLLDYYAEIERYDRDLGEIVTQLEKAGRLDDTLVIVTSDNGMPFPRAKANLYDYGARMPLAIRWPRRIPGGHVIADFVSHTDLAPTILEAAGLKPPPEMTGRSLLPLLVSGKSGRIEPERDRVFFGRERHAQVREGNLSYPARALRTERFLYIRNFRPDRWPAGDPPGYGDIDGGPSKEYLIAHRAEESIRPLFDLATAKRSAEELYDLAADPHQQQNVAGQARYAADLAALRADLDAWMHRVRDPRGDDAGDAFDRYPYFGKSLL